MNFIGRSYCTSLSRSLMILLLVYVIDTPVKVVIIVKVEIESSQLVPILAFCTQQMANKQIITDPPLSFRKLGKYTQHFGVQSLDSRSAELDEQNLNAFEYSPVQTVLFTPLKP